MRCVLKALPPGHAAQARGRDQCVTWSWAGRIAGGVICIHACSQPTDHEPAINEPCRGGPYDSVGSRPSGCLCNGRSGCSGQRQWLAAAPVQAARGAVRPQGAGAAGASGRVLRESIASLARPRHARVRHFVAPLLQPGPPPYATSRVRQGSDSVHQRAVENLDKIPGLEGFGRRLFSDRDADAAHARHDAQLANAHAQHDVGDQGAGDIFRVLVCEG